jgi:hypothetical protein
VAGVAGLRLDAAQRHHEAAPRVAPVGAQRHHARDVEGADHLARAADAHAVAQVHAHQRVVHQQQALLQRRAHMVGELHRRRARAALGAIHHDEVGRDAGGQHGLDDGKPLPRVAHAELEARGLAARQLRSRAMNCIISTGVEKALWLAGEMQSTPLGTPRAAAISAVTLAPGSTPPWPGLAPWLSLSSIILTCGSRRWRQSARR